MNCNTKKKNKKLKPNRKYVSPQIGNYLHKFLFRFCTPNSVLLPKSTIKRNNILFILLHENTITDNDKYCMRFLKKNNKKTNVAIQNSRRQRRIFPQFKTINLKKYSTCVD